MQWHKTLAQCIQWEHIRQKQQNIKLTIFHCNRKGLANKSSSAIFHIQLSPQTQKQVNVYDKFAKPCSWDIFYCYVGVPLSFQHLWHQSKIWRDSHPWHTPSFVHAGKYHVLQKQCIYVVQSFITQIYFWINRKSSAYAPGLEINLKWNTGIKGIYSR